MLAFFVVIRVTDSEGAYCDSNDLSCGGILPGIMITVTANNSAPIFDNSFATYLVTNNHQYQENK